MRLNNQVKVGLATIICLLIQGYVFAYIMGVEPSFLISFAPLILYIIYIYANGRRSWYYDKPIYWIVAIITLTVSDLAVYALTAEG